ncbi:MAG: DUF167 domain-containing protein [Verrucomicrobiales bacterium]|nr:DUF167 domain-containing protein [Verrucomicrobiales bacterium]
MAELKIRVIPNAKQSCLVDWFAGQDGELLRIRLAAPPVDGKANKALIVFLSKTLGVGKSDVKLVRGEKNRQKTIEIASLSSDQLREKIDALLKS